MQKNPEPFCHYAIKTPDGVRVMHGLQSLGEDESRKRITTEQAQAMSADLRAKEAAAVQSETAGNPINPNDLTGGLQMLANVVNDLKGRLAALEAKQGA